MVNPFVVQGKVRGPWRTYLDALAEHRGALHAYCRRLTGNIWDGEDLMQDTFVRVFAQLGKADPQVENPRAYLIRAATNLWIDRVRRSAREQAALAIEAAESQSTSLPLGEERSAARRLFQSLHPQERAATVMKDVLGLSLEETAAMLATSVGAVKSALSRARGRLDNRRPLAGLDTPPPELVDNFLRALSEKDFDSLRRLCDPNITGELVGGLEMPGFDRLKPAFEHAHMTLPIPGFGINPRWQAVDYEGERMVIGFRTVEGVEGLNEIHRLDVLDGRITRVRLYCFTPETLAVVAADLGFRSLPRPFRSPTMGEGIKAIIGIGARKKW